MARKIIWTDHAWKDVSEIAEYIAKDSPYYARTWVQETLRAGRSLDLLSERGREAPELDAENIREIFIGRYRLIYQLNENEVSILAIIHGARDFGKTWKER